MDGIGRGSAGPHTQETAALSVPTGLFEPDGVSHRVHCDPVVGLAAMRAILLAALHPAVSAAIDHHSEYRHRPWVIPVRFARYIAVCTFGTTAEALLAASRARAVHHRVKGVCEDGDPYDAEDPDLLAWGHACLVASCLELATRAGLRLSGDEQDVYVREQARVAVLVGLEPPQVPQDRRELRALIRRSRPALRCTPAAQEALWAVVHDSTGPVPFHPQAPAWAPVAGLAYATLPGWARRLYGIGDPPGPAGLDGDDATAALAAWRDQQVGLSP